MWIMEILVRTEPGKPLEWVAVKPFNQPRYEYETREEAERMLRICYGPPSLSRELQRVREV